MTEHCTIPRKPWLAILVSACMVVSACGSVDNAGSGGRTSGTFVSYRTASPQPSYSEVRRRVADQLATIDEKMDEFQALVGMLERSAESYRAELSQIQNETGSAEDRTEYLEAKIAESNHAVEIMEEARDRTQNGIETIDRVLRRYSSTFRRHGIEYFEQEILQRKHLMEEELASLNGSIDLLSQEIEAAEAAVRRSPA